MQPRRRNPAVKKTHLIQLQAQIKDVVDYIKEKETVNEEKKVVANEKIKIIFDAIENIEKDYKQRIDDLSNKFASLEKKVGVFLKNNKTSKTDEWQQKSN